MFWEKFMKNELKDLNKLSKKTQLCLKYKLLRFFKIGALMCTLPTVGFIVGLTIAGAWALPAVCLTLASAMPAISLGANAVLQTYIVKNDANELGIDLAEVKKSVKNKEYLVEIDELHHHKNVEQHQFDYLPKENQERVESKTLQTDELANTTDNNLQI